MVEKKIEFLHEDAQDIANEATRSLIANVTAINGNVPEIMMTLNILQALVVKTVLVLSKDGMNMKRADTLLDMSIAQSKEIIRGLSVRSTN